MRQLESVLLDLNRMRKSTFLCSEYQEALTKVMKMQDAENEHEKQLAKIEAQRPVISAPPIEPRKTIITWTEQDGLYIEHPERQDFNIGQRFILAVIRWAAVIVAAALIFCIHK